MTDVDFIELCMELSELPVTAFAGPNEFVGIKHHNGYGISIMRVIKGGEFSVYNVAARFDDEVIGAARAMYVRAHNTILHNWKIEPDGEHQTVLALMRNNTVDLKRKYNV